MSVRFVHVQAAELGPYAPALRRLEEAVTYPIADGADRFRIDHGPDYHPFFSALGVAHFVLALDGDAVIGAICGMLRRARIADRELNSVYLGDLKLHRDYRGQGVVARMLFFALSLLRQRRFRRWRLAYGAAMRGERGDVMRSARGLHPARLSSALASLDLYFASPEQLAALRPSTAPPPLLPEPLDLSPEVELRADALGMESTAGRKDLRLVSTGQPWPLLHLTRSPATADWPAYLARCGGALVQRAQAEGTASVACFALDQRLPAWRAWLQQSGILPGAMCTVYGLRLSLPTYRAPWVHLATSEI